MNAEQKKAYQKAYREAHKEESSLYNKTNMKSLAVYLFMSLCPLCLAKNKATVSIQYRYNSKTKKLTLSSLRYDHRGYIRNKLKNLYKCYLYSSQIPEEYKVLGLEKLKRTYPFLDNITLNSGVEGIGMSSLAIVNSQRFDIRSV